MPQVDIDGLPPTEYLVMDVLAARARLGEPFWTVPSRMRPTMRALAGRSGLVIPGDGETGGAPEGSPVFLDHQGTGEVPEAEAGICVDAEDEEWAHGFRRVLW